MLFVFNFVCSETRFVAWRFLCDKRPLNGVPENFQFWGRGAIAVALNRMAISLRQANCDERAAYGNRTRLLGLGSRCTTDVLMPRKRLQKYNIFFNCANICTIFFLIWIYANIFVPLRCENKLTFKYI